MANTYTTGTNFTFASVTYTLTSLTYTMTEVEGIDVSHLGQTVGESMLSLAKPLKAGPLDDTGREVSIEYLGASPISDGSTGTLVISGGTGVNAAATVSSSSVTLGVNDIVRGSATFRVAR